MSQEVSAAQGALLKGADTVATTRDDLKNRLSSLRNDVQSLSLIHI